MKIIWGNGADKTNKIVTYAEDENAAQESSDMRSFKSFSGAEGGYFRISGGAT